MNLFKKYPSITNSSQSKVIDYIRMNLPEQQWIVSEKNSWC
uniref:RNA editing ligase n=1 Tax=Myoviridae sp. ctCo31 TaxID=2825053 RepID=A0A8S5UMK8_9CAUD|nr:MAG TPA: RNA editing ligase [Myoviridae sp. ctCo31]